MPAFSYRIDTELAKRKQLGLERSLLSLEGANSVEFSVSGKSYINFSSNDYLGLASSKQLAKAWQEGIDKYGAGSAASPMVTGHSVAHQTLEETLCEWFGYDRAILFNSGFAANQAVLFSLLGKADFLVQDKLNHASLMEAGILSPAQMKRFKHNDVADLNRIIANNPALVVTEGVFSMDGDCAPLDDIATACQQSDSWLMVDDAHGVGVLGERGVGSIAGMEIKPQLLVVTFGKAFGLSGAAILCDQRVGNYLTQFSRHHVYSTAMPPSQAYALTEAANMLQQQQWRREHLAELQLTYDQKLQEQAGYVATTTPIKPFICGSVDKTMALASKLKQHGFWVTPIRPPTVAKESCRIRITLNANHTHQQVSELAQHIINS